MKHLIFTLALLSTGFLLSGQCDNLNPSLESWSQQTISFDESDPNLQFPVDLPDDHTSVLRFLFFGFGIAFGDAAALAEYVADPQAALGISQSTDANTGDSAAKLTASQYLNFSDLYTVWRCTELPDTVEFSMKHLGTNADTLFVLTVFDEGLSELPQDFEDLDNYSAYATAEFVFDADTDYEDIKIPITQNFEADIDTAYILLILTTDEDDLAAGNESSILIDDIGTSIADVVLSIDILDFNAKQYNRDVICKWGAAAKDNNSHFVIEKSLEGISWDVIVKMDGVGNTDFTYEYEDPNPVPGMQYYRLKQIDVANKITYSNVMSVNYDPDNQTKINVYPNPVVDIINIEVSGNLEYISNLYDLDGKLILSDVNASTIQIESIPAGTYMLEIKDQNSDQTFMERIVVGQ